MIVEENTEIRASVLQGTRFAIAQAVQSCGCTTSSTQPNKKTKLLKKKEKRCLNEIFPNPLIFCSHFHRNCLVGSVCVCVCVCVPFFFFFFFGLFVVQLTFIHF